ncbi:hypothetical protein BJX62DRAFT_243952 [Aspergillus germanicus]
MADPDGTRWIGIKQRPIANVRNGARIPTSARLPQKVEYAIIGSGIAGCSVAWNLLTQDGFEHTVAVLEARGLASGATGRSGGQVRLMALHEFADMSAGVACLQLSPSVDSPLRVITDWWSLYGKILGNGLPLRSSQRRD